MDRQHADVDPCRTRAGPPTPEAAAAAVRGHGAIGAPPRASGRGPAPGPRRGLPADGSRAPTRSTTDGVQENRDRVPPAVAAELPAAMAEWLDRHASPRTLERVARDAAVAAGRVLLAGQGKGEAGWNTELFTVLTRDPSPAVRGVAARLGCDGRGRAWSAVVVAPALVGWFGLGPRARDAVQRRLR